MPRASKNLIPLSPKGLWEAETTAARSRPRRLTRIAAAGVGRTPASSASPPAAAIPAASAASSIVPDSRVSRTIRTCGRSASSVAVVARPRAVASSAVRKVPASPRTPSVPKSLREVFTPSKSALAELRALTGLLETGLAPLLDPGVAGEKAAALEVATELGVDLGQGAGDAVADRPGLAADAAAVDADADVDVALVTGDHKRLLDHRLVQRPREELLEVALVDFDLAVAGQHGDAGNRALAFAGSEETSVFLHLRRRPVGGGVGLLGGGELGFTAGFLFFLGFEPCFLLGAQLRFVRLDQDRLEVGARDDVFFFLLGFGLLTGSLLGRRLLSRGPLDLLVGLGRSDLLGDGLLSYLLGRPLISTLLGRLALLRLCRGPSALVLSLFVLRRLVLFLLLVVHQVQSVSICFGCCAACGWSGPAYTFSLVSCWRARRLRGSIPLTALRITSSGLRSSISPSVRDLIPPG